MKTEGCYITTTRNEKMEGNIPSTPSGEQKAKHTDTHLCFQWHLTSWYHNFLHPSPHHCRLQGSFGAVEASCAGISDLSHTLSDRTLFCSFPDCQTHCAQCLPVETPAAQSLPRHTPFYQWRLPWDEDANQGISAQPWPHHDFLRKGLPF